MDGITLDEKECLEMCFEDVKVCLAFSGSKYEAGGFVVRQATKPHLRLETQLLSSQNKGCFFL